MSQSSMPIGPRVWLAALLIAGGAAAANAETRYLPQGWSAQERGQFYWTSQGSEILPFRWFRSLERPATEDLFLADGLARFGYIPAAQSPSNPHGLPVGFVTDKYKGAVWVGMTCAACHTSRITFRGQELRIDGAGTGADMFGFISELGASLAANADDDAKFARFQRRVLGAGAAPGAVATLRQELRAFSATFSDYVRNSTADAVWGPARLDAFGMIFNRVTSIDLDMPQNSAKPNAPVSYPHLWGIDSHDHVQWDGSVPNRGVTSRLARNVGEVLGVFARIDLQHPRAYYSSTARRLGLLRLEGLVGRLGAPKWPADLLGGLDTSRVSAGRLQFETHCLSCHAPHPDGRSRMTVTPLAVVRTDPAMVESIQTRQVETGVLAGRTFFFSESLRLAPRESAKRVLDHAVIGAILEPPLGSGVSRGPTTGVGESTPSIRSLQDPAELERLMTAEEVQIERSIAVAPGYKARSLEGIWATAPYLHNGSVASLWELLLPSARRQAQPVVGSREFDPSDVGLAGGTFTLDTTRAGNSKDGHDYGTGMTDEERRDLLEYLKSL